MTPHLYYEYVDFDNEKFFTCVLLPEKDKTFPSVIIRDPYVKDFVNTDEMEIVNIYYNRFHSFLDRGYAIVFQHCRGQGKSTGAFVPYVHEREDGLALREWIRKQSFYNGELFLFGASYTASLHYVTAPFEEDIKGAVLEVQDSERYRLWYRNGQMRKGHANWHFNLYKNKCGLTKTNTMASYAELPIKGLSTRVLGDTATDFEEMLEAPSPNDAFWNTRNGGNDAKDVLNNTDIPVLLGTGYNDFYVGGIFDMWSKLSEKTKQNCALLVSPYAHGDGYSETHGLPFNKGMRREQFGDLYQIEWFDNIRKGTPVPFKKGIITYYRDFEDVWAEDFYKIPTNELKLKLGDGISSFTYNPSNPPSFMAEGFFQYKPNSRPDMISIYTNPFEKDTFVKGKMGALLNLSCDCEDTSVYINISIEKPQGDYTLRHDITSLCYQLGDYKVNEFVDLRFSCDEHAFLVKQGERIRIDISATDNNTYVCHTNYKGPYHLQTASKECVTNINLEKSFLILPVE